MLANPRVFPLLRSHAVPGPRILVVEDEAKTAETVRLYLENAGFEVAVAGDGRRALRAARGGGFALAVLDLMLPEIDGLTVCRRMRSEAPETRILMLTARSTEEDRVRGLETGADDYLVKPFSPRELVARVRAVLRRGGAGEAESGAIRHGQIEVDPVGHTARIGDRPLDLTPTELRLLATLAAAPERVFTRAELVDRLFGPGFEGTERNVDTHVANLRRKLEPDRRRPRYLVTVFGVGYRLGAAGGEGGRTADGRDRADRAARSTRSDQPDRDDAAAAADPSDVRL